MTAVALITAYISGPDEAYPVFWLDGPEDVVQYGPDEDWPDNKHLFGEPVQVTVEQYTRWREVRDAYRQVQREMEAAQRAALDADEAAYEREVAQRERAC